MLTHFHNGYLLFCLSFIPFVTTTNSQEILVIIFSCTPFILIKISFAPGFILFDQLNLEYYLVFGPFLWFFVKSEKFSLPIQMCDKNKTVCMRKFTFS